MIACGPPKATTMTGMVMKGPTPTIWLMLMAVAWKRPMRRESPTVAVAAASAAEPTGEPGEDGALGAGVPDTATSGRVFERQGHC